MYGMKYMLYYSYIANAVSFWEWGGEVCKDSEVENIESLTSTVLECDKNLIIR